MRYRVYFLIGATLLTLVGCTYHDDQYLRQAQTVSPIASDQAAKIKQEQSYYPVPAIPKESVLTPPPLVPPGSDLQRFEKQKKNSSAAGTSSSSHAYWETSTTGAPVLVLSEPMETAWASVGHALQATPYRILDQDESMHSYFILDAQSTSDKITKTTPIYRVYLKRVADRTRIILLNQNNQPAAQNISQRILGTLQKKLQ